MIEKIRFFYIKHRWKIQAIKRSWMRKGIPLILAILVGLLGSKIAMDIGKIYTSLASDASWYHEMGFLGLREDSVNNSGNIFRVMGACSSGILTILIL